MHINTNGTYTCLKSGQFGQAVTHPSAPLVDQSNFIKCLNMVHLRYSHTHTHTHTHIETFILTTKILHRQQVEL